MSIDRRKTILFGAAAAVRLLLFTGFPGLPDLLTARVEISTPVTSFKRCKYFAADPLDSKLILNSTGGTIPLQSQRLTLRWGCLPPGSPSPDPFRTPSKLLNLPNLHIPAVHFSGFIERQCSHEYSGVGGSWILETLHVTEEGQEVE